jgi:uncharacterized UPF0160 family protein
MKLPAKLRISGYDCRIFRSAEVWDVDGQFGEFDPNQHTIRIAESEQFSSELLEAGTIIHEALHAIIALYNIKAPDEEALVEMLETAFVQLFRDNKTFIRGLLKALK